MKSVHIFLLAAIALFPKTTHAQYTDNEREALFAHLGIRRMVVKETPYAAQQPATRHSSASRSWETETFLDRLGRPVLELLSSCAACEASFEYDSLSGKLAYGYNLKANNDYTETYYEYDEKGRCTLHEICHNGNDETCKTEVYEYAGDSVQRKYNVVQRLHLRLNTNRRANDFLRLRSGREEELELLQETFYNPDGKVREKKMYHNGTSGTTTEYTYNPDGNLHETKERTISGWHNTTERVYDDKGRFVKAWITDVSNRKWLSYEITYNKKGWMAESKLHNPPYAPLPENVPMTFTNTYTYDADGLLTKLENDKTVREYTYFRE